MCFKRKKVNGKEFLSVFIAAILNKTLTASLLRMTIDVETCDVKTNSNRRVVITNSIHPENPEKRENQENQTTKDHQKMGKEVVTRQRINQ